MESVLDDWLDWLAARVGGLRETVLEAVDLLAFQVLLLAAIVMVVYLLCILPEAR